MFTLRFFERGLVKIDKLKLGPVIQEIRTTLGISREALCEKSGLSASYLSLLENGKRGIGMDHLNQIAEILGVPASLFVVLASEVSDDKNNLEGRFLGTLQELTQQAIKFHVSR